MSEKDQSYEDAFDMDTPAGASDKADGSAGYGLDPRAQDALEMAAAFDAPNPDEKQDEVAALNAAVSEEKATGKPEFKTFGEAFKWHRQNGDKVFEWKGKSFNTKLRSEVPAKAPVAAKSQGKPQSKSAPAAVVKLNLPAIKDPVKVPDAAPGFEILFAEAGKGGEDKPVRPKALKPEPAQPQAQAAETHVPPFAQETKMARPYVGTDQGWASADDKSKTLAKAGK